MADTFKQLVLNGKGGPWTLEERPIPKAGVGQLVVKMTACSICNQTDLNAIRALHPPHDHQIEGMYPHHFRQWDNRLEGDPLAAVYPSARYENEPYPTTMGHEGTGIVVEVGPMPEPVYPIGCKGKASTKLNLMDTSVDIKVGDRVSMVGTLGGFGEYIVTPIDEVEKIDERVDAEAASLFEPTILTNAVAHNNVSMNDTVLILGQGALGLLSTQMARAYGAAKIITTDVQPFKREMSKKMGADYVLDPNEGNVADNILALTDGQGADVVIECAGEPEAIRLIPYVGRQGARIGQIGACCVPLTIDWSYIHFKGYNVSGSQQGIMSLGGMQGAKKAAAKMMASGKIDYASLITHRLPLTVEAAEDIFKKIEKGDEVIKAIFKP